MEPRPQMHRGSRGLIAPVTLLLSSAVRAKLTTSDFDFVGIRPDERGVIGRKGAPALRAVTVARPSWLARELNGAGLAKALGHIRRQSFSGVL